MKLCRLVYHGISHESIEFSRYTHETRYHAIETSVANIRAVHDTKIRCNAFEYTTTLLYSNWFYFLCHAR